MINQVKLAGTISTTPTVSKEHALQRFSLKCGHFVFSCVYFNTETELFKHDTIYVIGELQQRKRQEDNETISVERRSTQILVNKLELLE